MLDGGAIRSTSRGASCAWRVEDIGLADPRALIALDACETYERLGSPEGELALAQGGRLPRVRAESQRGLRGLQRRARIHRDGTRPVPLRLRNAPTRLMKGSATARATATRTTSPMLRAGETLSARRHARVEYYQPTERGLEARIGDSARSRGRSNGKHAPPEEDE